MKKNNCDDCFKGDVCQYKQAALKYEKMVNDLEEKPSIISVLIHCDKYSRKHNTSGTKEESKQLS